MSDLLKQCEEAKQASHVIANLSLQQRNDILIALEKKLLENIDSIIEANKIDLMEAEKNGLSGSILDRLALNESRIKQMAEGVRQIAGLPDVLGFIEERSLENGLTIKTKKVPLGLIGIIYESRPNVTVDATALCLKSGNAVILRGGKEAINTNLQLLKIIKEAISSAGFNSSMVEMLADTSRETLFELMKQNKYIDILIPRGGSGLINSVRENATIPVIETGTGNCHIYVDENANLEMALSILINGKCQRPSVCNACETLLVHKNIAVDFLSQAYDKLLEQKVELRGCEQTADLIDCAPATEDDFFREYNALILAVKIVDSTADAIAHINKHGSKHSESIISDCNQNAQKFLQLVDAAVVYKNTSTRFTDGGEFGFGAEIGISTQKLHARGPMGLKELTTIKYVVESEGKIR